jgi:hypothetical protein
LGQGKATHAPIRPLTERRKRSWHDGRSARGSPKRGTSFGGSRGRLSLQVCEECSFNRERNDDCKLVGAIIDRPREKRERVLGKSCFPPMDECLQFKFRTIVIGFYSSTAKVFRGVLRYFKACKSSAREFEEALRKPSLAGKVPSACEADE